MEERLLKHGGAFGEKSKEKSHSIKISFPFEKEALSFGMERIGFEPTMHFIGTYTLSRHAPSATRTPLLRNIVIA